MNVEDMRTAVRLTREMSWRERAMLLYLSPLLLFLTVFVWVCDRVMGDSA